MGRETNLNLQLDRLPQETIAHILRKKGVAPPACNLAGGSAVAPSAAPKVSSTAATHIMIAGDQRPG